jgi:hypothetical protein
MATMDDLVARLRRALGNQPETVYSTETLGDAVKSALKEYSKYKPIEVLDWFGTMEGEPVYDLSRKRGIIRVKDVYYDSAGNWGFDESLPILLPEVVVTGNFQGINLFENPSIWTQYSQRLEQFKRIFEGTFDFDRQTKRLRLIPPPSSNGQKVIFIWTKQHSAETVAEEDEDALMMWGKAEAKEMLAAKKENEIRSVSGYGESVTFGATSESLTKDAKDLKDQFRKQFKGGSTMIVG